MERRQFLKKTGTAVGDALGLGLLAAGCVNRGPVKSPKKIRPNLVFVFADQWRAQATGYAGDPNAITPNIDSLAKKSVNFTTAVSCYPVCSPYRASLMTGQYPLTHGVFLNDVQLGNCETSIAMAYNAAGYDTAYIGKWHLDGHGRSSFVPPERRQGFKFWNGFECSHDYNNSFYYDDKPVKRKWDGYDATAQTRRAQQYITEHSTGHPFALFLSWGPPHCPYDTAPQKYKDIFEEIANIKLRPNVPHEFQEKARIDLSGYYAHIAALDKCVGDILRTLRQNDIEKNTIFVFTSDHGDMLYSQGKQKKQQPWDESIRVPFLLRYPAVLGVEEKRISMPFNSPDIMPTLLGLSAINIPETVEGTDFSGVITGRQNPPDNAALIACYTPFGEWPRNFGGKEYRGIRTERYTYVRDMQGAWLLYDNEADLYQQKNLCNKPQYASLQKKLENILKQKLHKTKDKFQSGWDYINSWGHTVDEAGNAPYF